MTISCNCLGGVAVWTMMSVMRQPEEFVLGIRHAEER